MLELVHLDPHAPIICNRLCDKEDAYRYILILGKLVLDTDEVEKLLVLVEVVDG